MPSDEVIIRFAKTSFEHGRKPILAEADFSVRRGAKVTLMGQNGAGKTTLFWLIAGDLKPESGSIVIGNGLTIALSRQVIPRDQMDLTVLEFFEKAFTKKIYDIEPRIKKILEVVHLTAPLDRTLKSFSGGQQARLLLAQALIQDPDILLLDEPTNNLDKAGIAHLTQFLIDYKKTCIVISHDADFLNSFTQGVLYLDIFTHKVEQYTGNYFTVVEEIKARLERERMKNVRLQRDIQHRKEQANFFGQKGGHLRDVARKMNEKIEELEGDIVEVRQEDRTIRNFAIPCQEDVSGKLIELTSLSIIKNHKPVEKKVHIILKKKEKLLLQGPNGIGKTTLLEALAKGHAGKIPTKHLSSRAAQNASEARSDDEDVSAMATQRGGVTKPQPNSETRSRKDASQVFSVGEHVTKGVRIGYYRQDFSTLDFDKSVYETLADAMEIGSPHTGTEQELRSCAAGFLLDSEILKTRVGSLSEGQKGLVAFATLTLQKPGLLILDEPTNHINFRHIPVIAAALDRYEGAMILVSHVPDFVKQIKIDYVLDLETL
jgi:ATP-binding cassette subfamily F protein 3